MWPSIQSDGSFFQETEHRKVKILPLSHGQPHYVTFQKDDEFSF